REGQIAVTSHFVLKGCIRQYYLVDGVEKTVHFYTQGEPVTATEGSNNKLPSKYFLACVEDCILSVGQHDQEAEINSRFPKFETVCRVATEEELARSHNKFASFLINTPEERYLQLLQTRPDLVDRVPQYHLASFLGITPESLSRIRKRIMTRKHSM
ncbi:MAG: Crp/Fnr family transcriptional regulator, partial [Saprospiraceae bacterium]|nr:Crp/Fnr family transcriptional regulator [Saprospiraceae bacterium]